MPDLKPHSWAQSGSPTSTILNRIREHNIEFGGSPARVAHTFDVPLYEIPADHVVVSRETLQVVLELAIERLQYQIKPSAADEAAVAELRAILQR